MFVGHYAVAFAAKRAAPRISLGTLVLAALFVDLLWPLFLLLGIEQVRIVSSAVPFDRLEFTNYPLSHSLLCAFAWSLLLGGLTLRIRRSFRDAIVVGLTGLSHWVLDLLSHHPDLPLLPGAGLRVGLGLWSSVPLTILVETGMVVAGIAVYLRATRPLDRTGSIAFCFYIAFLTGLYVGNLLGPPPPDVTSIAIAGLGSWLFVAWAYWIDRHRTSRIS